ncbi:MAG: diaminopimelate epimerase [Solirubrobacterales bacterium]|nr:diaminopimelate epimerase [Solirubrobacterales bacterium]
MKFEKWQALGNDYLIVDERELPFQLTPARVRALCRAHFGVGADGILLLSAPADPSRVARLRIHNPDGSEAELSGNGAREAVLYLRRHGWTTRDTFTIETAAGDITPTITGPHSSRVDMGTASLTSADYPAGAPDGCGRLRAGGRTWEFRHVSIGNPQCAIAVPDTAALAALDLAALGPPIEAHPDFPNRTNVSWYAELEPRRIRARIFERGVGETLSSGTGATGAAIAHRLAADADAHAHAVASAAPPTAPSTTGAGAPRAGPGAGPPGAGPITVVLDGGELEVEVGEDLHVHLTGWARPVFAGRLHEELIEELRQMR